MGTTPTFALPFPEATDPADVPTDMQQLAQAVEDSIGEPLDARIDVVEARPACRVTRAAVQSIPNAADTALIWDTVRHDEAGAAALWAAGQPTRLTCKEAGLYTIRGNQLWVPNASGFRWLYIFLNGIPGGATNQIARMAQAGNATENALAVETSWPMIVGDYVELVVQQTSGVALNISKFGKASPEFMIERVS